MDPIAAMKKPAGHPTAHEAEPTDDDVPVTHAKQLETLVVPEVESNKPAEQLLHANEPTEVKYVPTGHPLKHATEPTDETVPLLQLEQIVAPEPDW